MYIKTTLVVVILFFTVGTQANCLSHTKASQYTSEYERIYCEIVSKGGGKNLPRFEDFKRNDVMVQRLLLKRSAEKLKITLPAPSKVSATKRAIPSRGADKSERRKPVNKRSIKPNVITPNNSSNVFLSQCSLGKNIISCGQRRFGLIRNESNSRLASGVLDDHNLMALPTFKGNAKNNREVQLYLSEVYGHYIQRMVDIGLGASTMSYARFYHTFYDLQARQVDFSERFETMYHFLKKDKKAMAVKSLPSHKRPHNISQCDDITNKIVVCDIGSVNWVYMDLHEPPFTL